MKYDWNIIKSAKELSRVSQEEKFPYFLDKKDAYGLKIIVNKNVFSPKHANGYKFFVPKLPDVTGMNVLEIGCGHGIVSCHLAIKANKVLAVDINPDSVENTKINAELNDIDNLETRVSDVYSAIQENEKFDLIFWNTPWAYVPNSYEEGMNPEDYGMFDPGYKSISKFILEGHKYINSGGSIYLGFGIEGSNKDMIEKLIIKSEFKKEVVADDFFFPGEKINNKLVKFRLLLFKLYKD